MVGVVAAEGEARARAVEPGMYAARPIVEANAID